MTAPATDWLSLAEAKAALQLEQDDTRYGTAEAPGILAAYTTAVSERLDELVGPAVQREVASEVHDLAGQSALYTRHFPISAVSSITDQGVTLTAQTPTAHENQPATGYALQPYDGRPVGLFSGTIWRTSGMTRTVFSGRVVLSYTAGRFVNTAAVAESYKQAARLTLRNLWRDQELGVGSLGQFDVPVYPFPRFDIPDAALSLLSGEHQ